MLTAGNVSDIGAAPALLAKAGLPRHLIADKGYDADALIPTLIDQNRWAQSRSPSVKMRQGWFASLAHASQP